MRWDLEEGLREDRSKCWRREDAAVVVVVVEEEIEETAAARLRASSISSLSSSLTSILLAFLLSIFPKLVWAVRPRPFIQTFSVVFGLQCLGLFREMEKIDQSTDLNGRTSVTIVRWKCYMNNQLEISG